MEMEAAKTLSTTQSHSHSHSHSHRFLLLRDQISSSSPPPPPNDDNVVHCRNLNNERIIITAMAAVVSFCLIFLLIYKCVFHRPPDQNHRPPTAPNVSVDEELASIPVVLYEESSSSWGDIDKCAICLEEYVHGDRVRVLPRCNHVFHKKCIEEWFQAPSLDCPICREQVLDHRLQSTTSNCRNLNIGINATPTPLLAFNFGGLRYASYPSTLRIFA